MPASRRLYKHQEQRALVARLEVLHERIALQPEWDDFLAAPGFDLDVGERNSPMQDCEPLFAKGVTARR